MTSPEGCAQFMGFILPQKVPSEKRAGWRSGRGVMRATSAGPLKEAKGGLVCRGGKRGVDGSKSNCFRDNRRKVNSL